MNARVVALVGNPNSGKSTLFNALTGRHQHIGNWCGVTVEKKSGWFQKNGVLVEVVDLPGCYDCLYIGEKNALDEQMTVEYIASHQAELILNVVDATHLERHLYVTLQLLEQGIPVIVALNLMDVTKKEGIDIQVDELAKQLGCPVVPLVAAKKEGIEDLKRVVIETLNPKTQSSKCLNLILSEDKITAAKARYDRIYQILNTSVHRSLNTKLSWTDRIDKIVLNRFLGIPLFLALMYCVFIFTIQIGGVFQDLFEVTSKAICIDGVGRGLAYVGSPEWITHLMAFGAGQGIHTTVSFIPVIAAMFLSLSFLETSGYMARAAFVMDKMMQWVGLPGKSFVPMIIGFGCNVPAVMATRTLENARERILTILMSPFMSCGARLAIYALFVSAFFPVGGQNIIFGLYLIGILVALLTGFILRTTVLSKERSALVIELPAYRWPTLGGIYKTTWQRLKRFILKAGVVIVLLSTIISALGLIQDKIGMNNGLARVGRQITPVFAPMGIEKDNWPATVGLLTGILAKEVVVGTLNACYAQEEHQISKDIIVKRFKSPVAAFAYLLFVLLYFPCVSVVATIAKELNRSWALFSVVWTTGIAYITAVLFYQSAMIQVHPFSSIVWIIGMVMVLATGFYGVRKMMRIREPGLQQKPFPTPIFTYPHP